MDPALSLPSSESGDPSPVSLELLLDNLSVAVYRCRNDSRWTMEFVSEGISAISGYSPAAFTINPQLSFASLILIDDRRRVEAAVAYVAGIGSPFQLSYWIRCADGTVRRLWERGTVTRTTCQGTVFLEGVITDVTRAWETETLVEEQASLLQRARDATVALTMDSRITFWNSGAERLYGWSMEQVKGQPSCDVVCEHLPSYTHAYERTLRVAEWHGEFKHMRSDGSTIIAETSWTMLPRNRHLGTAQKILVICAAVTEHKHAEERIKHLAFVDGLAELPDHTGLMNNLHHALVASARSGLCGARLFCDLDNFKRINATDGHAVGDLILQAVTARFTRSTREADIVARLGGDEFVVLIQPCAPTQSAAAAQAEAVAEKLIRTMATPIQCADKIYSISVRIGITIIRGSDDTVVSALQEANLAIYLATAYGRNTFRCHDASVQAAWCAKAELERYPRRALRYGAFMLYDQPQLDEHERVIGAEALLGWRLPNGEVVYPEESVKIAEESHLIPELGDWVLREACQQLATWQTMNTNRRLRSARLRSNRSSKATMNNNGRVLRISAPSIRRLD